MSGRIPEHFVDELLRRIDIVEVIEARVPLKRTGREYQARCPFHDERSPSFTVSPQKQFYHCFGCGAHGSAIGFLMQYDGLEFRDAIEELAQRAGLALPTETRLPSRGEQEDSAADYALLEQAQRYFHTLLPESAPALAYLERRGVDADTVERFGLGYAGEAWDGLGRALGGTQGARQRLLKLGLLIEGGRSGAYDRFRDRLMFPIHDRRGRVIAFGGRVIGEGTPKYMNSPESGLFHKGRELYGLHRLRQARDKPGQVLVVEGYMDVIALDQAGITEAVATLGTATTRDHAETLFRTCESVVFCFDGDRAGRDAAWRAAEAVLPRMREGRSAAFLFLPDGEDPDSLVRQEGAAGLRQRISEAEPLSEFLFRHLGGSGSTLESRARLAGKAKPLLQQVPEGSFRDLMFDRLERLAGVRMEAAPAPAAQGRRGNPRNAPAPSLIRRLISRLLQQPALALEVDSPYLFRLLEEPGIDLLAELLDQAKGLASGSGASLVERFRERSEYSALARLLAEPLPGSAEEHAIEFRDFLEHLNRRALEARIGQLQARLEQGELDGAGREELRQRLFAKAAGRSA